MLPRLLECFLMSMSLQVMAVQVLPPPALPKAMDKPTFALSDLPTPVKPLIIHTQLGQFPVGSGNPMCEDIDQNGVFESNPLGPLIACSEVPEEFLYCTEVALRPEGDNATWGTCSQMGGARWEDVEWTKVVCHVLPCIDCKGSKNFYKARPCIIYRGHYFLSTLLYSIFLGIIAVDRFSLGYSAIAVGKLMTVGGFGCWWIADIVMLITGHLTPADNSNWEPYY